MVTAKSMSCVCNIQMALTAEVEGSNISSVTVPVTVEGENVECDLICLALRGPADNL